MKKIVHETVTTNWIVFLERDVEASPGNSLDRWTELQGGGVMSNCPFKTKNGVKYLTAEPPYFRMLDTQTALRITFFTSQDGHFPLHLLSAVKWTKRLYFCAGFRGESRLVEPSPWHFLFVLQFNLVLDLQMILTTSAALRFCSCWNQVTGDIVLFNHV